MVKMAYAKPTLSVCVTGAAALVGELQKRCNALQEDSKATKVSRATLTIEILTSHWASSPSWCVCVCVCVRARAGEVGWRGEPAGTEVRNAQSATGNTTAAATISVGRLHKKTGRDSGKIGAVFQPAEEFRSKSDLT